ncbi:MAG: iron complex transport system substrate-binding protein [Bradymonadia bacterium]|jgi:iron complex transport system substrate-binding protein
MRIVSLLPAATEIVCAIGAGADLVGVSHACDWPQTIRNLPRVTAARRTSTPMHLHGDPLSDALSVFQVDVDTLVELDPDLIVTQDLCSVCAVDMTALRAALGERLPKAKLVSLTPHRFADLFACIGRIGAPLRRMDEASLCMAALSARIDHLRTALHDVPARPKVLTLEWLDPWMPGALWTAELISLAGGDPIGPGPGEKSVVWPAERWHALHPDVVFIKPCGYGLEQTRAASSGLVLPAHWPAVQTGQVWLADGQALFNRPGPRLIDSAEVLAAALHPDRVPELVKTFADHFCRWAG